MTWRADPAPVADMDPDPTPFAPEPVASDTAELGPITLEPKASRPASPRRPLLLVGLGLVAGCVISGGVFWGLGQTNRSPAPGGSPAPAPPAVAARPPPTAPEPGPPPAVAAPEPAPPAPSTPPTVDRASAPTTRAAQKQAPPRGSPPGASRLAEADVAKRPPGRSRTCAGSTPADRLVCNDLSLQLFDLQLQDAYDRALDARVDPAIVIDAQAAWRRARDEASDPQRLARLYNQRIHELDAATAAARENRPPE